MDYWAGLDGLECRGRVPVYKQAVTMWPAESWVGGVLTVRSGRSPGPTPGVCQRAPRRIDPCARASWPILPARASPLSRLARSIYLSQLSCCSFTRDILRLVLRDPRRHRSPRQLWLSVVVSTPRSGRASIRGIPPVNRNLWKVVVVIGHSSTFSLFKPPTTVVTRWSVVDPEKQKTDIL